VNQLAAFSISRRHCLHGRSDNGGKTGQYEHQATENDHQGRRKVGDATLSSGTRRRLNAGGGWELRQIGLCTDKHYSAGTTAPEEERTSPSAWRMIRVAEDKPRKAMTAATAMSGQ
jgi:hypothetical protein